MPSKPKVLVAMSGGVDSSVAAALLQREGYDVVGCFMRLGSPGETLDELRPMDDAACPIDGDRSGGDLVNVTRVKIGHQGCCSINDAADARLVAAQLNIPFYVCNFKKDFGRIIDYFVEEYASGRTPNPCVRCNDWLKFGKLHEYASQIGAEYVASGHYARIALEPDGSHALLRGIDASKDQSYVLFGAPRDRLAQMLLPIGGLEKIRVRELAHEFGLPVFDKPDSQEICFVPDNDYAGLVERRNPATIQKGEFVDTQGNVLGQHGGQHQFTIGQRRGLSLALGHPVYVVGKDAKTNTVIVGGKDQLLCVGCRVGEANWLVEQLRFGDEQAVMVKYRYNSPAVPGILTSEPDATAATPSGRQGRFSVRFAEPQSAVAPGQALVLFDAARADRVLGGGWIEGVTPHRADV